MQFKKRKKEMLGNRNEELIKSFKTHLNKNISKGKKTHIHFSNIIIKLVQINNKIISTQKQGRPKHDAINIETHVSMSHPIRALCLSIL